MDQHLNFQHSFRDVIQEITYHCIWTITSVGVNMLCDKRILLDKRIIEWLIEIGPFEWMIRVIEQWKFVVKLLKLWENCGSTEWELFGFELSVLESVSSRKNISDLRHA
jgi:hypothetical protein